MARPYLALHGRYELIEDRFAHLLWLVDGLLAVGRLVRRRPGPIPPDPKRILVQSALRMGDGVLAVPGILALRRAFPNAELDVLASPESAPVMRMVPEIGRLFVLDNPIYHLRAGRRVGFSDARDVLRRVRARGYDWAVDFVGDLPGNWALSKTGARATIAHDSMGGGAFLTHPVPRDWTNRTASAALAEVLHALGIDEPPPASVLEPVSVDRKRTKAIALQNGLGTGQYLVCAPAAGAYRKAWPANRFWAAIERFASPRQMPVALIGAPDDEPVLRRIAESISARSIVLAGEPIGVIASLIGHAAVYLGNDTGPSHIAAATKTPRVVVFGPTPAERFGHPDRRSVVLGSDACPYLPCSYLTCRRPDAWCMLETNVETVVEALERVSE